MSLKVRIKKLADQEKAKQDAWLKNLSTPELEAIERDSARAIREGDYTAGEVSEYCRIAEIYDLAAWLEEVGPLQPGDREVADAALNKMIEGRF